MAESLPFLNSTGLIDKILNKIKEAQTPERYTQDFQGAVLGYGSGSARPFIPLLKKLGFLNSDGKPSDLYHEFRNDDLSGAAMAKALKIAYAPLFKANEFADKLSKDKLKSQVIQITGLSSKSKSLNTIVNTFEGLKKHADFDYKPVTDGVESTETKVEIETDLAPAGNGIPNGQLPLNAQGRGMNLSYTINLNLPPSKDPEVFNAIFKSLKENLLS